MADSTPSIKAVRCCRHCNSSMRAIKPTSRAATNKGWALSGACVASIHQANLACATPASLLASGMAANSLINVRKTKMRSRSSGSANSKDAISGWPGTNMRSRHQARLSITQWLHLAPTASAAVRADPTSAVRPTDGPRAHSADTPNQRSQRWLQPHGRRRRRARHRR